MASCVSNTSQSQETALLITEERNRVIIRATGPTQLEREIIWPASNARHALDVNARRILIGRQIL